ncbi:CLUMA_CG011975, isoform A, partial [Clunio marinus]
MDIFPTELELTRLKRFEFRIPYAYYEINQSLEEHHRGKLARAIVYTILEHDPKRRLGKTDFLHLTALIVKLFPTEIPGTFYNSSYKSSMPTGKLHSAYLNIRNALVEVKIITRERRSRREPSLSPDETDESTTDHLENSFHITESENIGELNTIKSAWEKSYSERQKFLSSKKFSISNYINLYPFLRGPQGYFVFRLDAEKKFPQIKNVDIRTSIASIAPRILDKVKMQRNEVKATSLLKEYLNERNVNQSLLALILMPFIFSPAPFKRTWDGAASTSTAKHSKADAYRYFCSHFRTKEEMQTFDETLPSSTSDLLPPRLYIIGNLKNDPTAVIRLDDIEYTISDPLDAFDVMFKIFIGLNLKYPRQSVIVWTFIERFVYRLNQYHINNSQLLTIINEMTNYADMDNNQVIKHGETSITPLYDGKKRCSIVWKFFGRLLINEKSVDENHFYCSLCLHEGIISSKYTGISTSGMINHLRNSHKINNENEIESYEKKLNQDKYEANSSKMDHQNKNVETHKKLLDEWEMMEAMKTSKKTEKDLDW